MELSKKEKQILTFFEHGVRRKGVNRKLNKFFGFRKREIKQIIDNLNRMHYLDIVEVGEPKISIIIISKKVEKNMLDNDVLYILQQASKFHTFKEFLQFNKKRHLSV